MEDLLQFPIFPALFCFILFIFIIQKKLKKSKAMKLPPGPRKLPIIGNMLQLIGSLPHRRLADLSNQHGPIMHLQLGEVSNIVISSREFAKEMLKTHDISFAQRPLILAGSIVMYNFKGIALGPYGDNWRQLRKICILELFSLKRVQSFKTIREEEVSFLVNSVSSSAGSPINLTKMALALSNAITLRTAFGNVCKQKHEFLLLVQKIMHVLEGFSVADFFPSVKFLHVITGMRSKLERLHQEADMILENIIKEHRATSRSDLKSKGVDLVDVLLNLQDHGSLEFPLTLDSIKATMLDIFLGGTESSATIIEWTMSELLKNSRVMEKTQTEIRQVFNKRQYVVDETSLQKLKYLKLVIKETLRLHPVGPLLPRECREKAEINGYEIPVNTKVIVNIWKIGRDPRYWSEAENFYPKRYLDNPIDYKGNDFQYIPFGAGRRMCPGLSYGMAVVELSLASLLYHFDWKLSNGMESNDLDMSESFGATTRRKHELHLISIPYHP